MSKVSIRFFKITPTNFSFIFEFKVEGTVRTFVCHALGWGELDFDVVEDAHARILFLALAEDGFHHLFASYVLHIDAKAQIRLTNLTLTHILEEFVYFCAAAAALGILYDAQEFLKLNLARLVVIDGINHRLDLLLGVGQAEAD